MNLILLFLLIFALYFLFAVCAYFFGSMLTEQPLQLSEAVFASLLLAFLAAIPSLLLLTQGISHHRQGIVGARGFPALAMYLMVLFLVKKYECDVWPSILQTIAAVLPAALILYSLRDVLT